MFDVLAYRLGEGRALADAVKAPRVHTEGDLNLTLEAAWPAAVTDHFKEAGYAVKAGPGATAQRDRAGRSGRADGGGAVTRLPPPRFGEGGRGERSALGPPKPLPPNPPPRSGEGGQFDPHLLVPRHRPEPQPLVTRTAVALSAFTFSPT